MDTVRCRPVKTSANDTTGYACCDKNFLSIPFLTFPLVLHAVQA